MEGAYSAGITTEQLAYMTTSELVIRISSYFEMKQAENLEQWRMVRRLVYYNAIMMGSKMHSEEELWRIEGDRKTLVTEEKINEWRKWMIDNGKMKGEA